MKFSIFTIDVVVSLALAIPLALSGCTSSYQVSTFDGKTFETKTTPILQEDGYQFRSKSGTLMTVPYTHVKSVKTY